MMRAGYAGPIATNSSPLIAGAGQFSARGRDATLVASGDNTLVGGELASSASADNAIAWGSACSSSAINSQAFGDTTISSGPGAQAMGFTTVASGDQSYAGGASSNAVAAQAWAFGQSCEAGDVYARATGYQSLADVAMADASGWNGHADLEGEEARGAISAAAGGNPAEPAQRSEYLLSGDALAGGTTTLSLMGDGSALTIVNGSYGFDATVHVQENTGGAGACTTWFVRGLLSSQAPHEIGIWIVDGPYENSVGEFSIAVAGIAPGVLDIQITSATVAFRAVAHVSGVRIFSTV